MGVRSATIEQEFFWVDITDQESILDISSAQGRSSFNVDLQDLLNEITLSPRERPGIAESMICCFPMGQSTKNHIYTCLLIPYIINPPKKEQYRHWSIHKKYCWSFLARGLANPRRGVDNTLWFNLLGLGNVIASVVIEHDELLDTFVGTMQIHGPLELQRFQRVEATASETLTEANVQQLEQPRIHRPPTTTVRSLRSSRSSRSRPVPSQVRSASHRSQSHGSPRFPARPIRLWGAGAVEGRQCVTKKLLFCCCPAVECHQKLSKTDRRSYWRSSIEVTPIYTS